jgi:hypothetical protein
MFALSPCLLTILTLHQPTNLKAPFLEQFTDDWDSRWKASHAKKQTDKSTEEEWQYVGTWSVEEPTVLKGMEGDKGLVVKDKAAHHAISAKFAKPIDPKGKDLIVQYEVKLQGKRPNIKIYIEAKDFTQVASNVVERI